MPFYQKFPLPVISPDPATLLSRVQAVSPTAGVRVDIDGITIKRSSAWTPAAITAAQGIIDACPPLTAQSQAQTEIDQWSLSIKALVLALIDQLNVLRAALPVPLPAITPAQALAAIRNKAGTL